MSIKLKNYQFDFRTVAIVFLFIYYPSFSQYNETIRSGRPGQSIGAYTVGKNIFQLQSGIDNAFANSDFTDQYSFVSNNVIRVGLMEHFELSTLFDYQYDQIKYTDSITTNQNGLSNLHLGFRYNITDQPKGWIPAVGFQTRFRLPVNSSAYDIAYPAPVMILVTTHKLKHNMGFTTNWIASFNGNTPDPLWRYILNLSFPIHDKWSGFIENYGSLKSSDLNSYIDGGIAYLVNNNLQLDVSGGVSKNDGVVQSFVSTGISLRTHQ